MPNRFLAGHIAIATANFREQFTIDIRSFIYLHVGISFGVDKPQENDVKRFIQIESTASSTCPADFGDGAADGAE